MRHVRHDKIVHKSSQPRISRQRLSHGVGQRVPDEHHEPDERPDYHRSLADDADDDAGLEGEPERTQNEARAALVDAYRRRDEPEDEINYLRQRVNNVRHARRRLKAEQAEYEVDLEGGRDVREKVAALGADFVNNTPEEFDRFMKRELAVWSKVVKEVGIKID